jgi:formylglycine-generating enzyme required for sulfatase activity
MEIVFISHAAEDASAAYEICKGLETSGLHCWLSSRDVPPGMKRSEAIVDAIQQSGVVLVLISSYTGHSTEVKNEVERAVNFRRILIPIRLEEILPTGALEYFLSTAHWFDAFPDPLHRYIPALNQHVWTFFGRAAPETRVKPKRRRQYGRMIRLGALVFLFLILVTVTSIYFYQKLSKPAEARVFHDTVKTLDENGQETGTRRVANNGFVERLSEEVSIELMEIPEGTFQMGLSRNDANAVLQEFLKTGMNQEQARATVASEMPSGRVTVVSFYLQRTEVTQDQWAVVSKFPRVHLDLNSHPSRFAGTGLPVESISWDEALEFCARLSRKTSRPYRLPSEAEWEYACRAGTSSTFYTGEALTDQISTFNTQLPWGKVRARSSFGQTRPSKHGSANAFGLSGMHGNVAEWVLDFWHDSYRGSPSGAAPWQSGGDPDHRVARGGSFEHGAVFCRCGSRFKVNAKTRNRGLGFRVALYAGEIKS